MYTGSTGTITSTVATSGTVSSHVITSTGFTPSSTTEAAKVVSVDLTAPSSVTTLTISATATLSNGNTCSSDPVTINVVNPTVATQFRACNSTDMLTCAACDNPAGFTGTVELHSATQSYGSSAVTGNTPVTFSSIPGSSTTGTYVATLAADSSDWTVLNGAKSLPPSGDPWNTATTYGPYDFCVTQHQDPWVQLVGGDGLAAKGGVSFTAGSTGSLLGNLSGITNSSGVIMSRDTTTIYGSVGPTNREWAVSNSSFFTPPKEGFNYFLRTFELGSSPVAESGLTLSSLTVPTTAPASGKEAYYVNGNTTIDTPWHITNGQSYTFFVNGSLTISNDIVVDHGGFLAFVVSGNTTVTGTVSQLQGIYISDGATTMADGNGSGLITLDSGKQLLIEGTVVGWSGLSMTRTLDNLDNNTYPAVRFTYRPDFLTHIPTGFKRNAIGWREVTP
jgi:hypothetical protein